MNQQLRLLVSGAICLTLLVGCQKLRPSKTYTGEKVKVELYIMAKCPYTKQAQDGLFPVLEKLGPAVDFQIDFIANEKDGNITALHGPTGVQGNIIQLCAIAQQPDPLKFSKMINCQNQKQREIPKGWEDCAKEAGLDVAKLKACADGEQGKQLQMASLKRAQERGARGSPTIFIGGESHRGGRSEGDFLRAICAKFEKTKPEACTKIPEPVTVQAIVLSDKRCTTCDTDGMLNSLRGRFFPKLEVQTIDYGTEEGKALYKELETQHLPIIVFKPGVEKAEQYKDIQRWMVAKGEYQMLRVPATFDPTAEICDNGIDDTGNGLVDCADPTCKDQLVCRKEIPNHLQVFVMSQCPYGVKALDAMKDVLDNFKGKLQFDVHYIASEAPKGDKTPRGFSSLSGAPEVNENIRQLCAKKHYGKDDKYLDYIWCRNKNYRSDDWKPCATGGISAAVIAKCSEGSEGEALLRENIKIANALQIGASPTWLANNRHKFSGIDANTIKQNVCNHNKDLINCDKTLSATPAGGNVPAGAACGQ